MVTPRRPIRRAGVVIISLVTFAVARPMSIAFRWATIPMVVSMHVPRAVATRSVGEKASPFPMLSFGASVSCFSPDGPWIAEQRSDPS
jgi:hypothetical protein